MPQVIEAPRRLAKRHAVLFLRGEWTDAAALATPGVSEAGTAVTDLQRRQPSQFWGQASPAVVTADRGVRALIDAILMPYARVPLGTTWRIRLGDSANERDGVRLTDASGHLRSATLVGAPTFVPGLIGGGIRFDPTSAAQYGVTTAFAGPKTGTLELAFCVNPAGQWLAYHAGGGGVARGIYQDAAGVLHVHRGNATPLLSSPVALPTDDAWHCVAYRFNDDFTGDAGATSLVVDGDVVAEGTDISDAPDGIFWVGGGDAAIAGSGDGVLDEIRYWPTVRGLDELANTAARELTDAEAAACVLYYRCNGYDSGTLPFPAPGVIDFTTLPDPRCHAFHFLPQRWVVRHLRIDISGPTVGEILRFGGLLGGEGVQPKRQTYGRGGSHGLVDGTTGSRGPGALLTFDPEEPYPVRDFTIGFVSQEEMYADFYRLEAWLAGGRRGAVVMNPADERYLQHKILCGWIKFQPFSEPEWDHHSITVRVEGMP